MDMLVKGRQGGWQPFGILNPACKLTPEQLSEIVTLYQQGCLRQKEIAARFEISQVRVSQIIRAAGLSGTARMGFAS